MKLFARPPAGRIPNSTLILTAVALLLGFAITVSVQTNRVEEQQQDKTTAELIAYIEQMEQETAALEERISTTRTQIETIQSEQTAGQTLLGSLNDSLVKLNQQAGLTDLTGSGLLITLDDNTVGAELAKKNNPAAYNAENYIVHDKDLLYLIRSLAASTEAVSINSVRLTDTSSIRCAGTVIIVNSTRLSPPYEVTVLGDSAKLERALKKSSRYLRLVYANMPVSYVARDDLTVPAYTGAYTTTYSTLLKEE